MPTKQAAGGGRSARLRYKKPGDRKPGEKSFTLSFDTEAARRKDQRRRDTLKAYRQHLKMNLKELTAELARLSGDSVSYYTVRGWCGRQDAVKAIRVPGWTVRLLEYEHGSLNAAPGSD